MEAHELRRAGAEILSLVLAPHGFRFVPGTVDRGSGGDFAQGAFVRETRRLEFSARAALGLVAYRFAERYADHEDLLRLQAQGVRLAYPGFSDDPLDGFRDLASDLTRFGHVFLGGTDLELTTAFDQVDASPRPRGFAALERPPAR